MKDKNVHQEGYSLVSNSAATVQTTECGKKFRNIEGMGWVVTCLFIVGETAGGGLIAMPSAMVSAGLIGGMIIILLGAIICAYTGLQLSENWTILQERWPEYRNHCRKPYGSEFFYVQLLFDGKSINVLMFVLFFKITNIRKFYLTKKVDSNSIWKKFNYIFVYVIFSNVTPKANPEYNNVKAGEKFVCDNLIVIFCISYIFYIVLTFTVNNYSEIGMLQKFYRQTKICTYKKSFLYPAMGLRAFGPMFMTVVSACLNVTMFGTAVVFLLLAAKNLENFLNAYTDFELGFCYLVLIVASFMWPFTMLKSPKDFWWAVIGAMITTSVAVSLIVYGSLMDGKVCMQHVNYPDIHLSKFFMSFGTVMFAYGGHGAFPTIQHDMKRPYHFKRSVFLAFLIIFLMYLPVSLLGYLTYGDSLRDSVIPSLQNVYVQQAVNFLITLHVILALTNFGVQRILSRSVMMLAVVFVAETVPNFGVLLDLVGGSTITLMALIFPIIQGGHVVIPHFF